MSAAVGATRPAQRMQKRKCEVDLFIEDHPRGLLCSNALDIFLPHRPAGINLCDVGPGGCDQEWTAVFGHSPTRAAIGVAEVENGVVRGHGCLMAHRAWWRQGSRSLEGAALVDAV